jgi:hypothetical protein
LALERRIPPGSIVLLFRPETRSLHQPWFVVFVAGLVVATLSAVFVYWNAGRWPGGGSPLGLTCGVVGAALIIFEFLLWPRKRLLRRWRIGRVRTWMAAHIWLGLLTVPLILVHGGLWWGGPLAIVLMILFIVVIASGILGLALQQILPKLLLDTVPEETIYSQIEHLSQQLVLDAEAIVLATCGGEGHESLAARHTPIALAERRARAAVVLGAERSTSQYLGGHPDLPEALVTVANSKLLLDTFQETIRPFLQQGRRSGSILRDKQRGDELLRNLKSGLNPAAHPAVDALGKWCEQRRQFDRQARIHFWLHVWLAVHLPLSAALVVLMVWHAVMALKYSGFGVFL